MEFVPTKATATIATTLAKAPASGGITLIYGHHGTGKRWGLDHAIGTREDLFSTLVVPTSERPGARSFFGDIARELGLKVPNQWSAGELAIHIASHVRERGLTLVLNRAHRLRAAHMPLIDYMVDLLPHLVIVGDYSAAERLLVDEATRVRVRRPQEIKPMDLAEVIALWGDELCEASLAAIHKRGKGLISDITLAIDKHRDLATATQTEMRHMGLQETGSILDTFLLSRAA